MARIKLVMPEKYIFTTTIPVRITDLNYGNHLANDALLSIIHEARVQFLGDLGYSELDVDGVGIIMGDVVIIYKTQAYYGDILQIEIAVADFSRKSCDFYYRITQSDNKIVALAKTAIIFYDYQAAKPAPVPHAFINKITAGR